MTSASIVSLILVLAPVFNIDPYVAISVAYVESDLNPKAIGKRGEVGLFQIMPSMYIQEGYTKEQMKDPIHNIYLGLSMLKYSKDHCIHKGPLTFLVCYNAGLKSGNKIQYPIIFPYVTKVKKKLLTVLSSNR
jgi:soluble lytic murein transglycosylase-like protein